MSTVRKLPLRLLLILGSVIVCGVKGLLLIRLPFIPGRQNKEDMWDNCFGIMDPRMEEHWDSFWEDPGIHQMTNLLVEWNRLHAQRGAKALCALILVALVAI